LTSKIAHESLNSQ